MIAEGHPAELMGREADLRAVRSFADRVGAGHGGALVVVGEYGVGKSSLTRALLSHSAMDVVHARAQPGERGPDLAARVLATNVLGSAYQGRRPDSGLMAAAEVALDAITKRAARGPVVWVVDDLDLADRSARTFMGYVVRRIAHLPAGMVLTGWRRGEPLPAGAEVVRLHPLPHQATADLVRAKLGDDTPDWVVLELAASSGGNPLAAAQMTDVLTPDERSGLSATTVPPRAGHGWDKRWSFVSAELPDGCVGAMLVAAAGDGVGIATLEDACTGLGISADSLHTLESRRLLHVDSAGGARTRRPHRSAAYHHATEEEQRAAHLALSTALARRPTADAETALAAAWHRAVASTGPDDVVASQLVAALGEANPSPRAVDGWIRAANLTTSGDLRSRHLVTAARVSWQLARPAQAGHLLELAEPLPADESIANAAALVRGGLALSQGIPARALDVLARGAIAAATNEPELAVDLAARAAGLSWWAGRSDWVERAVDLTRLIDQGSTYSTFVQRVAPAAQALLRREHTPAVGRILDALRAADQLTEPRELLFAAEASGLAGDDMAGRRLHDRAVQVIRSRGASTELAFAMQLGSFILAWQGRVEAAAACAEEGLMLAARAGERSSGSFQHAMHAHISALRGDVDGCADHRTAVMEHSDGQSTASVDWAWGRLALSRGRPQDALPVLLGLVSEPDSHPVVGLFATPDLVEAAIATGQREVAVEPYERFVSWARAGAPWAASVEPRLAALMATNGEDRDAMFEAACGAPGLTCRPLESARTRLCYANALRTQRRRSEAREQLHVALGLFDGLQLPAWAQLARSALRASGEATTDQPAPSEGLSGALTEQELTIAGLVSSGSSNREVADVLHLSSRTVEYHLSKIYVKLGLSSREQLAPALGSETR